MTTRDHLIAFIKGVMQEARGGDTLRHDLTLGALFGTGAAGVYPSIRFGYGYHDFAKVLFTEGTNDGNPRPGPVEMGVEDAVDHFLAGHRMTGLEAPE